MDQDQHPEKEEEENKFQESSEQQRKEAAAEEEVDNAEESMDQQREAGYKEGRNGEEESTVQLKEVESGSEEASPSLLGIFAHPCSLLQYLLHACAGRWGLLHGAFRDPKPPAAVAPEAAAPANSTSQEGEGGEKQANCSYMQEEVVTRVWAVKSARPPGGRPGHPREGNGGNGGIHH